MPQPVRFLLSIILAWAFCKVAASIADHFSFDRLDTVWFGGMAALLWDYCIIKLGLENGT